MGVRKELRVQMQLPVRIWGMDADGDLFEQNAFTVDITTTGAQIWGIYRKLNRGSIVGIQHKLSKARFRVMWIGIPGAPNEGCIGVQLVDRGKYIWGQPLPRIMGDDYEGPRTTAPEADTMFD